MLLLLLVGVACFYIDVKRVCGLLLLQESVFCLLGERLQAFSWVRTVLGPCC
jgi:hypothetical protein